MWPEYNLLLKKKRLTDALENCKEGNHNYQRKDMVPDKLWESPNDVFSKLKPKMLKHFNDDSSTNFVFQRFEILSTFLNENPAAFSLH